MILERQSDRIEERQLQDGVDRFQSVQWLRRLEAFSSSR
jgi:hypothetical protein